MTYDQAVATLDAEAERWAAAQRKGRTDVTLAYWLDTHLSTAAKAALDSDAHGCERSDCTPSTCCSAAHS